ncbi:hypothetical protein LAT59_00705 [Candidatus Gracilibacteria bacterium]|nr:hypothetical protein [Candidatus Gracilibacteria bacterium]
MFGKKILFLTAGYVAGSIVGSLYRGKKKMPTQMKSKDDAQKLAENFLEIQKNFINDIDNKLFSGAGKEKAGEAKEKFQVYAEKYLKEGEKLLNEINISDEYSKVKNSSLGLFSKLKHQLEKAIGHVDDLEKKTESKMNKAGERVEVLDEKLEKGSEKIRKTKDEIKKS